MTTESQVTTMENEQLKTRTWVPVETILALLKREEDAEKELFQVKRLMKFYTKELKEIDQYTHKTKEWTLMLISNMTDDHLINLFQSIIHSWREFDKIPDKYLDEAKKRWPTIMDKILCMRKEYTYVERKSESNRMDRPDLLDMYY